jgi:predicted phosphodiesterase
VKSKIGTSMRLAVVADIHGNLPALQAVIADIEQREVDGVVNLGDCVSGPLWPRETCELLMKLDWPTVRGNHDPWGTDWPPEKHYPGDAHASSELIPQHLDWLRRHSSTLDLGKGVFACHGQPIDDNAYLLESIENGRLVLARSEEVERRLGAVTANIILCGHSHIARTTPSRAPDVRTSIGDSPIFVAETERGMCEWPRLGGVWIILWVIRPKCR